MQLPSSDLNCLDPNIYAFVLSIHPFYDVHDTFFTQDENIRFQCSLQINAEDSDSYSLVPARKLNF